MSEHQTVADGKSRGGTWAIKTLVVLVLIVAAALIWFVLRKSVPPPPAEAVLPVETIRPTVGNLDQTIILDSFVESRSNVAVYPKVPGTIVALDADVGTELKAGEVIAKIDPEPYQLTVNRAKAMYDGAKAVYDRQTQLSSSGATSRQNLDEARTEYENARAEYQLAKLRLGYTTIASPIDGTVVQRNVSKGQVVSTSVPLVTITNTGALVVKTAVPESYARIFREKRSTMPISASIPALGTHAYPLRIRDISPAVDVKTKTFMVECRFEGDSSGIMPGMFAQVSFVLDRHSDVPYLPYSALVGGNTLWYVGAGGKAQFLTFTPAYHNDEYFELPEKYRDYTFILVGQHFLAAGTPVKIVSSSQGAK